MKAVEIGLWKFSRFPTYFADAIFWFGIYFEYLGVRLDLWWLIVFPVIYLAMLYCGIGLSEMELM